MKKTLLSALILLASLSSFAQTITSPFVESSDDANTTIKKVETNQQFTVVTLEYTASGEDAWAQVNKEIFLQTDVNNRHYNYVKAEDIPIAPAKHTFSKTGDKLSFKIYFEKIPITTKSIDIIERAGGNRSGASFFNFYNVSLEKSQGRVISAVVLTPPPINNANVNMGNNMSSVFNSMGPMLTNMATAMMDAQLTYYKQPGKIDEIAQLNKQYFDALLKAGFNTDQALKIITSESLLPKPTMGGK